MDGATDSPHGPDHTSINMDDGTDSPHGPAHTPIIMDGATESPHGPAHTSINVDGTTDNANGPAPIDNPAPNDPAQTDPAQSNPAQSSSSPSSPARSDPARSIANIIYEVNWSVCAAVAGGILFCFAIFFFMFGPHEGLVKPERLITAFWMINKVFYMFVVLLVIFGLCGQFDQCHPIVAIAFILAAILLVLVLLALYVPVKIISSRPSMQIGH